MKHSKTIGFEIKILSNLIQRKLGDGFTEEGQEGLTGMQGWVIGYLKTNCNRDVFQRDLEKDFNIRRATVAGVLKLMERDGLIIRRSVEFDARLKKIELTQKANLILESIVRRHHEFEQDLRYGLSDEEISSFFVITDKLLKNLQRD